MTPKVAEAYEKWTESRLSRALARYSSTHGTMLAGGLAFVSIFSLTAAFTLVITFVMNFLANNEPIRNQVLTAISSAFPGLITTQTTTGVFDVDSFITSTSLSLTNLIAFIVLIYSSLRIMLVLREGLRAMFGLNTLIEDPFKRYGRAALGFLVVAVGLILTTLFSVINSKYGTAILEFFNFQPAFVSTTLLISSVAISLLVDGFVYFLIVHYMCHINVPKVDMIFGCSIVAVLTAILRFSEAQVIEGRFTESALFGGVVLAATTMIWINLLARVYLYAAAWMCNPPKPEQTSDKKRFHANESPNYVTLSRPHTLSWPHGSITGALMPEPKARSEEDEQDPKEDQDCPPKSE